MCWINDLNNILPKLNDMKNMNNKLFLYQNIKQLKLWYINVGFNDINNIIILCSNISNNGKWIILLLLQSGFRAKTDCDEKYGKSLFNGGRILEYD